MPHEVENANVQCKSERRVIVSDDYNIVERASPKRPY